MKALTTDIFGRKTPVLLLILTAALSLLFAGCGGGEAETPGAAQPTADVSSSTAVPEGEVTSESKAIDAKTLFRDNCAKCHGLQGRGDGPVSESLRMPPIDLPAVLPSRSDEEIFQIISAGRGVEMPPFALILAAEQRRALVEHLRTLSSQ